MSSGHKSGEHSHSATFVRALVAGVSTHIFASYSFDFAARIIGNDLSDSPLYYVVMIATLVLSVGMAWIKKVDNFPLVALFGYLLLQWVAVALHHMVPERGPAHWDWVLILLAIALGWGLWKLYLYTQLTFVPTVRGIQSELTGPDPEVGERPRRLAEVTTFEKTDGLVMFLSTLAGPGRQDPSKPAPPFPAAAYSDADLLLKTLIENDIENRIGFDDLSSIDPLVYCNWYMPLKAIWAHVKDVDAEGRSRNLDVVVIPSSGEKGSWKQVGQFQQIVAKLAGPGRHLVQVHVLVHHRNGVDYEMLEPLSEAVIDAKRWVQERHPEGLVVVDLTGGKSTCSAVGAALTQEDRERFQYVSTTNYTVRLYDIHYDSRHLLH